MNAPEIAPVTEAVILMAGIGSRLGASVAKPLVEIGGEPLICSTFDTLQRVGVRRVHIVIGAHNEGLGAMIRSLAPAGLSVHTLVNPEWQKQNGVSVLCAHGQVTAPFFLTMGDHLFGPSVFEILLAQSDRARVNLAVDHKIASIFDLDDAMKVVTEAGEVVAIAKDLASYDAIDTGAFLCSAAIFDALRAAQCEGDCSLADGIRLLARDRQVRAVDIGDAWWQDVDTPEMLAQAGAVSARFLRERGRGLAEEGVAREG